jgi:Leucine-rich repeat (LRR) protein
MGPLTVLLVALLTAALGPIVSRLIPWGIFRLLIWLKGQSHAVVLGVTALLALVPLGLLLLTLKIDTPETRAALAISGLGGHVEFSGFFDTVKKVDFPYIPVTDEGLKELKECKHLEELSIDNEQVTDGLLQTLGENGLLHVLSHQAHAEGMKRPSGPADVTDLWLWDSQVTDEGLKELKDFPNLKMLGLNKTKVTDEGLKELKDLKNLKVLYLEGTAVTDAGLKELKDFPNLKRLGLNKTKVTDLGLKELKELKNLEELNLGDTAVTDAGLKELKNFPNLKALWLPNTKVTDAGLKELKELKNLEELNLGDTAVTDLGLKELKELQNLKRLLLYKTKVTDAGLKELREALPECNIVEKDPEEWLKMAVARMKEMNEKSRVIYEKLRGEHGSHASPRSHVSSATIFTVVKVLLAALAIIPLAIYVATKVWQRARRPG